MYAGSFWRTSRVPAFGECAQGYAGTTAGGMGVESAGHAVERRRMGWGEMG